jgi:hypothetical protein
MPVSLSIDGPDVLGPGLDEVGDVRPGLGDGVGLGAGVGVTGCATFCATAASAGNASATAAEIISSRLLRIRADIRFDGRHGHFAGAGRQENQDTDNQQDEKDEDCDSRHDAPLFWQCRRGFCPSLPAAV